MLLTLYILNMKFDDYYYSNIFFISCLFCLFNIFFSLFYHHFARSFDRNKSYTYFNTRCDIAALWNYFQSIFVYLFWISPFWDCMWAFKLFILTQRLVCVTQFLLNFMIATMRKFVLSWSFVNCFDWNANIHISVLNGKRWLNIVYSAWFGTARHLLS